MEMLGENFKYLMKNWESGCEIEKVDVKLRRWMWNWESESRIIFSILYNKYDMKYKIIMAKY